MTINTKSTSVQHRAVCVKPSACLDLRQQRSDSSRTASRRATARQYRAHQLRSAVRIAETHPAVELSGTARPESETRAVWGMPELPVPPGTDGVTFSFEGVTPRKSGGGGGVFGFELLSSAGFFGLGVLLLFLLLLAGSTQSKFTPPERPVPAPTDSSTIWAPVETGDIGNP